MRSNADIYGTYKLQNITVGQCFQLSGELHNKFYMKTSASVLNDTLIVQVSGNSQGKADWVANETPVILAHWVEITDDGLKFTLV